MKKENYWNEDPESENPNDYRKNHKENHYSNKGGHRERSLANDERKNGHKSFWQKKDKNSVQPWQILNAKIPY